VAAEAPSARTGFPPAPAVQNSWQVVAIGESANGYAEGAGDPQEVDVAAGHEENTGMSHGVSVPRVHNVVQACPHGGRRVTHLRKPCQPPCGGPLAQSNHYM